MNTPERIIAEFRELLEKVDSEGDFEKGISYEDRKDIYEPLKTFLLSALKTIATEAVESTRVEEKGRIPTSGEPEHQEAEYRFNRGWNAALEESQKRGKEYLKQFDERSGNNK